MRRKASVILTLLLVVIGILALIYPLISNWLSSQAQIGIIENYNEAVSGTRNEDLAAQREAAREYNEGLMGTVVLTDPFDEEANAGVTSEYETLLNINGDGIMGAVRIPKIDVRLPIYHGTSADVLKKGAGHLENTSLPVGGTGTHAVISTHTGYPTAVLFTELIQMEEGDLFFMDVLGEILAYRVDQIKVVDPSDTSDLLIDSQKDYVTLVTCTPYGINSHRLLVRGIRTDYVEGLENEASQVHAAMSAWNWPYIVASCVFVLILGLYIIYQYRRKKKRRIKLP